MELQRKRIRDLEEAKRAEENAKQAEMELQRKRIRDLEEEKKAPIQKIKNEAGNFHAVRLSSMSLAQKHAHFDTLGLPHKIANLGGADVKEILYSNDGQYVFVCNLYTDTCMK